MYKQGTKKVLHFFFNNQHVGMLMKHFVLRLLPFLQQVAWQQTLRLVIATVKSHTW